MNKKNINEEKNQCKNCVHFERLKWHKCLSKDSKEEDQLLGNCPLLMKILQIDNGSLCFIEKINIQDTFGCVFWGKKK